MSFSGPYTVKGKLGEAVFFPNEVKNDDNALKLGHHKTDCLGNVTLCPNGSTLSLWFRIESSIGDWGHMFDGTMHHAAFKTDSINYTFHLHLKNETHEEVIRNFPTFSYRVWHQLGITYDPTSGYEVYVDGSIPSGLTKVTEQRNLVYRNQFRLGCNNGHSCLRVHLDDFRFWTVKKSKSFMWWLWKIYE